MERIKCPSCGRRINKEDRYCMYCNNPLTPREEPAEKVTYSSIKVFRSSDPHGPVTGGDVDNTNEVSFPKKQSKAKAVILFIVGFVVLVVSGVLISLIVEETRYTTEDAQSPDCGYYIHDNVLYYFDDYGLNEQGHRMYTWWVFNADTGDWSIYQTATGKHNAQFIFDFTDDDAIWTYEAQEQLGISSDTFDINWDKGYIDYGHHFEPAEGYYYHNSKAYYYLHDVYVGEESESVNGWYAFNADTEKWAFVCHFDNKEIGEDLYYYPEHAYLGPDDVSWRQVGYTVPVSFFDTEWFSIAHQHSVDAGIIED